MLALSASMSDKPVWQVPVGNFCSKGGRFGPHQSAETVNGSIRLNWRLVHFRQTVIDYVVVHELSHLRVMDHSPRFWETVRTVVPDYAQLRGQLKDEALPPW